MNIAEQVHRRRTFAIISHPDAGKTTLTEKLLLYGGAIRLAGSVKSRKAQKYAVSDWMEIEKQRGISVTSSVMAFDYNGHRINILDTPGHQDFSEDTYRTLIAADATVMLIDGAKGVEPQTIKLFHVCKMRGIPIFTFVNKMDRASRDPFDLMHELEQVLGIETYPMNWPIGTEGDFKGVYDRRTQKILLYEGHDHGQKKTQTLTGSLFDEAFRDRLGTYHHTRLCDEIELLDGAGGRFDKQAIDRSELTPVFFGSAMSNFGVETFLQDFLGLAPPPTLVKAKTGVVRAIDTNFSAFIFKIQANMNPMHRDRLAFARICSGRFEKGMQVTLIRDNKKVKLTQPQQFMAQERVSVETGYAGDIIGLYDPGIFRLGDTLSEQNDTPVFEEIPSFPAEHFYRVSAKDSMKRKQFTKGIAQLAQEGAIQVFKQPNIGVEERIIGAVGVLQFDVLTHRLQHEYNVQIVKQSLPFRFARWPEDPSTDPAELNLPSSAMIVRDSKKHPVLLFENDWSIRWALEKNKGLSLSDVH